MNFDEAEVIAALARIFGTSQRGVEIGIGDDAAVVKTTERTAITTDIAVEGTHFSTQWSSAFRYWSQDHRSKPCRYLCDGWLTKILSCSGNSDR